MTALVDPPTTYFRAVQAFDVRGASDLVLQLVEDGVPMERVTREVLAPAQLRVGELWEAGTWSVADEHAATTVTEGALSALTHAALPRSAAHARHLAMVCVEGEWHSLPARMAAAVAGSTGQVRVTVLGPSLPADQLRRRLDVGDIDVLALSCTMPTNLIGAARCIAAAHDLGVPVIIGGRALGTNPDRAHALGADGWAADAEDLLGPTPRLAGRTCVIPPEVLWLDAVDDAVLELAQERIVGAFPELADSTSYRPARHREDLVWMARFTAAAVLTDDRTIVEDLLTWMCDHLRDQVSATVILTSAHLLADALEPRAAVGATLLRTATAAVEYRLGANRD